MYTVILCRVCPLCLCLLCGCGNKSVPAETGTEVSVTSSAAEVTVPESTETPSGRSAVTFAPAETDTKRTEASPAEDGGTAEVSADGHLADFQPAENQLEYSGGDIHILIEFTGAESLLYYPAALPLFMYRDDDFVLHSRLTVTNLSEKSFDFIPQKIVLHGRNKNDGGSMIPISERGTGLTASDGYYTLGAGETLDLDVDFVGDEICLDYAYLIRYSPEQFNGSANIDADRLDNVSAAIFEISGRNRVKNAVRAARALQKEKTGDPSELVPVEGEYSVLTHKNSYCFTAENIDGGTYIKVALRVQCLTGEPEIFEPVKFRLYRTSENSISAYRWSFDPLTADVGPEDIRNDIEGESGTLYDTPAGLYVRSDGTAEFTMYFFTENYDLGEQCKFSYEGENDVFDCVIDVG